MISKQILFFDLQYNILSLNNHNKKHILDILAYIAKQLEICLEYLCLILDIHIIQIYLKQ